MQHQDDERLLDLAELSTRLSVCRRTIRALVKRGGLPAYRIGTKFFFKSREIEAWIDARRVRPVDAEKLAAEICNDIAAKRGEVR